MIGPEAAPPGDENTRDVLRRFSEARLWAVTQAPYLASAVFALRPIVLESHTDPDTGVPAADERFRSFPTDTRWRVHLDPGTTLATPAHEAGWWLLHHIGHLIRHHAARSPAPDSSQGSPSYGPVPGSEDSAVHRWNQAADAEVNDDLEASGLPTPHGVVSPRALGLPDGRMAEEYVSLIEVLDDAHRRGGGGGIAEPIDCGSAAHGVGQEKDVPDSGDGDELSDVERHTLELAVAREIERAAAARSRVPGGWRRWADGRLRPVVDWRAELAAVVRRSVARGAGRVDYTYSRPARRPAPSGVVLPATVAPTPSIAVVVDTSGSVARTVLARFLSELSALIARVHRSRPIRVICCDMHAHAVQTTWDGTDIELQGGGGTDLREGITAAVALRPRPDLVVVLTDGDTPWPARKPAVPVVIATTTDTGQSKTDPSQPAWAHSIRLPASSTGGHHDDHR